MKSFALAASVIAFSAANASAADMAVKARPMVAPMPVYSWSGCYVGGNVGGGWGERAGNRETINSGNGTLNAGTGVPVGPDTRSSGVIGGAQVGCNYQASLLVVGVEADIQGSDIHGGAAVFFPSPNGGITDATNFLGSERINWLGTARVRLGIAPATNFLVYATGGFAFGGVSSSASLVLTPAIDGNYAGSISETRSGWTAGVGGEYAFANNWSVKLEYLFVDLGTKFSYG